MRLPAAVGVCVELVSSVIQNLKILPKISSNCFLYPFAVFPALTAANLMLELLLRLKELARVVPVQVVLVENPLLLYGEEAVENDQN